MNATELIAREEGFSSKPYICTEGYPTVGYGQRIGAQGVDVSLYEFELPEPVARQWLQENIRQLENTLSRYSWYQQCNADRAAVLVSMAYQLGLYGLLRFRKMLAAIEDNDWEEAAREALDSRWAKQTPRRARHHAEALRTGVLS